MTATKPFLRALAGETITPPPFWLMRQAGRYLPEYRATRTQAGSFLDLCYNPELAVEVTLQPLRRYGFDAAILFSDILVVPDGLGQGVAFKEGEGPVLTPIRSARDLDGLDISGLHDRMAPVYATVAGLSKAIPATTALIGFSGAPWTVATYMIEGGGSKDFSQAKKLMWAEPETFARLMELLIEATGQYLIRQIDAGAEAIQIFDTWAGALPETEFRRWVIEPARRLVERIHSERPGVPVIGFPRGAGILYEAYVTETKVDGVSLDSSVPLDWAARVLQPKCTVQGNLDPILLVAGGDALDAGIDRVLNTLGKGPFIFNLGHGIIPPTPPENVARLAQRVKAFKG
ncbi:uroporphyrinogen decarboxylase [Magnetospirillum gryphiswaldense]|uniref:Uroporphyrinogen decarboxylase n=1 Tax=Magnetospirillum gryphiswaldense TaxID=55518 RepID=A4U0X8_9PROT|nr:uroporphyrinogen decarboxylase [Magnetospirillum gryphiswaldense]AVM75507.1 Uroporphyrinogen decarboxylase [Magnetospirillum gryphiswaldense MSR-1]AVM79410.1 Uroporphyrinogen decarboxylase [Magnetospirillum gryphiswaldense]CAM76535.1 Uroporphyrinogen decarboxylase (URO-D) [Magnetospirillum gryphiswaldense MSR-1]